MPVTLAEIALSESFVAESWLDMVVRLLVAMALGAVCGWERELINRPAGLRTHMMVALGAAVFVIIAFAMKEELTTGGPGGVPFDPSRVVAGIITGIGFLGAGTIIQSGGRVRGLTTAAGLWVVAGIGAAAGMGLFTLAGITAGCVLFVLLVMRPIQQRLGKGEENHGQGDEERGKDAGGKA